MGKGEWRGAELALSLRTDRGVAAGGGGGGGGGGKGGFTKVKGACQILVKLFSKEIFL